MFMLMLPVKMRIRAIIVATLNMPVMTDTLMMLIALIFVITDLVTVIKTKTMVPSSIEAQIVITTVP